MSTTTAYSAADAARLELVARAVRAGIIDVGLDPAGDYYSDRAREILGYGPRAGVRPCFADLVHPEDSTKLALGGVPEGPDGAFSQALRLRRADGTFVWVGGCGSYVRNAAGRAVRLIATLTDISARKLQELQAQRRAKFVDDVVDLMPLEVAARDADGRFTFVNRAWERAAGRAREEVIGRTAFELFPAHQAQSMQDTDSEAMELAGRALYGDVRVHDPDGRIRYLSVTKTAMLDARSEALGVLATATDITARREAEQALKAEQQRLALVIQVSQAGVLDWDARGNKVYYSERLKEMLGYPPDADTSAWPGLIDRVHPDERRQVRDTLVAYLRGSEGLDAAHRTAEYRLRRADGAWLWVASRGMGQRDAAGRVVRYIATLSDITEIKRREAELRDQIKLTSDLIEGSPIPLYLKDAERRFVEVNAAFVRHSGIPVEGTLGRTALEIVPTERSLRYDEQDRELLARGEGSSTIEVEIPRADGPYHYIMNKCVLRRSDGSIRGLVGTITDVTRLKRVEAELRASREEALQAARAKAAFLATMSHEIRTPLNGVIGMTGVLLDTALSPEQHDYVETIRVSGETLLSVINDILDFSKIESGRLELERQPLELAQVIEQAFDMLGERARSKQLELLYEIDDEVPSHVYGDSTYLRQIIVNLVGNAVKFTDAGEVFVGVHRRAAAGDGRFAIEFSVSDTGIGIPPERLHVLFDAFTQADASTTRRYGGTGLGLAICKRLVELMGGTIAVASEPGRGSIVTFTIRCAQAPAPPVTDASGGTGTIAGRRVLIVDDNASNLRILEHQLRRWGLRAQAAASGKAALELVARGERFDAAIVDYQMPEMNGVGLAQALRRQAACAGLPIVLLSSSAFREKGGTGPFVARLLKPTRQSQLFDALVTALTGKRVRSRAAVPGAAAEAVLARDLPLSLLVVDDNDVNRQIAALLLRRFGYRADTAANGTQALAAVGRKRYDIVFMDVQMPEMDGYEATRAIAAVPGARRPVVVAMTANAMEGDRERCLAAGMSDYLSKPLEMTALRAALERWGGHARHPAAGGGPGIGQAQRADAGAPAPVDWSRLREIGGFDDAQGSLVRKLVAAFTGQGRSQTLAIKRAVARREAAPVAHAAHLLKGAALNVGAVALAETCGSVEQSAREGRTSELAPLVATLARRFGEAARLLGKEVSKRAGSPRKTARSRPAAKRTRGRGRKR